MGGGPEGRAGGAVREGLDLKRLPSDPAACHALIEQLLELLRKKDHQIEQLLKARFGPRADRLTVDPNQMFLFALEVLGLREAPERSAAQGDVSADSPPSGKKRSHGRRLIPADLPRRRVEYDVPVEKQTCGGCGKSMVCIGEDVSEQLEYEPASLFVIEHVQKKYACKPCEDKVVTAPKPSMPIEKGLPGPGLLAHVVVSKYADHLPLYRQEGILERHGIELSRQTMCDCLPAPKAGGGGGVRGRGDASLRADEGEDSHGGHPSDGRHAGDGAR